MKSNIARVCQIGTTNYVDYKGERLTVEEYNLKYKRNIRIPKEVQICGNLQPNNDVECTCTDFYLRGECLHLPFPKNVKVCEPINKNCKRFEPEVCQLCEDEAVRLGIPLDPITKEVIKHGSRAKKYKVSPKDFEDVSFDTKVYVGSKGYCKGSCPHCDEPMWSGEKHFCDPIDIPKNLRRVGIDIEKSILPNPFYVMFIVFTLASLIIHSLK